MTLYVERVSGVVERALNILNGIDREHDHKRPVLFLATSGMYLAFGIMKKMESFSHDGQRIVLRADDPQHVAYTHNGCLCTYIDCGVISSSNCCSSLCTSILYWPSVGTTYSRRIGVFRIWSAHVVNCCESAFLSS